MNDLKRQIIWCIVGNAFTVVLVMAPVIILSDASSAYFKFGWSDRLILISVKIDSALRYSMLFGAIAVINVIKIISEEIGAPILGFNIYNPDKKVITDFTKNELQFFGNMMFLMSGVRRLFEVIIIITQFDIALFSLLVSEVASLFTIRALLNKKTFSPSTDVEYVELTTVE